MRIKSIILIAFVLTTTAGVLFALTNNASAQGTFVGCDVFKAPTPQGGSNCKTPVPSGCDEGYKPAVVCDSFSVDDCSGIGEGTACVKDKNKTTSEEPTESEEPGRTFKLKNPLNFSSVEGLLDNIANLLYTLSIPLLVIMIIIGGYYLLTAGGNPEKIGTGKKVITWAIIGFVVILVAGSVASLITNLLGA